MLLLLSQPSYLERISASTEHSGPRCEAEGVYTKWPGQRTWVRKAWRRRANALLTRTPDAVCSCALYLPLCFLHPRMTAPPSLSPASTRAGTPSACCQQAHRQPAKQQARKGARQTTHLVCVVRAHEDNWHVDGCPLHEKLQTHSSAAGTCRLSEGWSGSHDSAIISCNCRSRSCGCALAVQTG